MTVKQGDGGGVVFRADDSDTHYYYLGVYLTGNYELDKVDPSGFHTIGKGSSSAIKTQLNQVNVIGIVAQGSTIDIYINMQHLNTFTDSTLVAGRVGVAAEDVSNSTVVDFNNLKVWIL
jgi:hypothetical protein